MKVTNAILLVLLVGLTGCATLSQLFAPLPIELSHVSLSPEGVLRAEWKNPDHHNATVVEIADNPGFAGLSVNMPAIALLTGLPLPAGDRIFVRLATLKNNQPSKPMSATLVIRRVAGKAELVP